MNSESDKLIRLLIVDEGLYQAEVITSALRSSGMYVLAEHAETRGAEFAEPGPPALDIPLERKPPFQ